jgi:outer membrane protein assembly factor BamB
MTKSVLALDAATGRFCWEYFHKDMHYQQTSACAEGKVFVWLRAWGRSTLTALDAETGEPVWTRKLKSSKALIARRSGPAVADGRLLVAEADGQSDPEVVCFKAATGEELWRRKLPKARGEQVVSPSIAGGMVLTGTRVKFARGMSEDEFTRGAAYALKLSDGEVIWKNQAVNPGRPLVSDGEIVVAKFSGEPAMKKGRQKIWVLDARTGEELWSKPIWIVYGTTTITRDKVIIKNYGADMVAYDRKTGNEIWNFAYGGGSGCCSPSVSGRYAYVGTGSFSDSEGELAWRFARPPQIDAKTGRAGVCWSFHAVDLENGKSVWHFLTGDNACGDPAIAYGRVYFNSRDGRIYCFEPVGPGEAAAADPPDQAPNASPDAVKKLLAEKLPPPRPGKDWPMLGGGPQRAGLPVKLAPPLAQAWKLPTGGRVTGSAAIRDGRVFVGSLSGKIIAADLASGAKAWEFDCGAEVRCSPAVAGGLVYCGAEDGKLYALDAAGGTEKWSYRCGGPVQASPAVVGGAVVFGASDHHLYMLDRKTGKKLWSFRGTNPLVGAPPVVAGDTVYAAQWIDWAYALDAASGKEKWRTCVPMTIESLQYCRDRLWLRNPYQFCEYDPADGRRLRLGNVPYGYNPLAFTDDLMFYAGTGSAGVLDLKEPGKPSRYADRHPALKDVMVVRGKGLLGWPRLASAGAPLVAGDLVCFASIKGEVLLVRPDRASLGGKYLRHEIVWSAALGGTCHATPVAADGCLVVGCDDGNLYCFRAK